MTKDELLVSKEDGKKLKFVRNQMGLSVEEFSEKTEINPSFINLLEKGCLSFSTRYKSKIKEAFGLPEDWFENIDISSELDPIDESKEENNININKCEEVSSPITDTIKQVPIKKIVIYNGDSLRKTRISAGLSRKEIADAIGITSVQIGYIETGKRRLTENVKNKLNYYFKMNVCIQQYTFAIDEEINNNNFNKDEMDSENAIYSISDEEILKKIKMIKREKDYTQTVVSIKSGVNRSQLSMIENGKMQISRKVKLKLIDFIAVELAEVNCDSENALSDKHTAQITSFNVTSSKENNLQINESDNIVIKKYDLMKVIESMKKTRDEFSAKIMMFEKVLNNM